MTFFVYLCNWLQLLGLAILVGGMIILGAVVAPTVFSLLPPMSTGGEVMATLFVRFNSVVAYVCLGMIAIGFLGKLILEGSRKKRRYIEGISLLIILWVGIYLGSFLTPRMDDLRHQRLQDPSNHEAIEEFGRGHRMSQALFSVNLLLGLVVLYISAMDMAKKQE
jgi:uncharacterized membrane protein